MDEVINEKNQFKRNDEPVQHHHLKNNNSHKLRTVGIVFLLIFLFLLLIAGWFGIVPGLSNIMGANKPRDLGIKYTDADFESYKKKTGSTFLDISKAPDSQTKPGEKAIFTNPIAVNSMNVTDEEITALVNKIGWLWMPVSNAQVRFTDNTIEVSGNLNIKYMNEFVKFIGGVGYSESDVSKAVSMVSKITSNIPIYMKANASVSNDSLSFDLKEVTLGRFNAPLKIASDVLSTGTSNAIRLADNLIAQSVKLNDGALEFSGIYPSTVYVRH